MIIESDELAFAHERFAELKATYDDDRLMESCRANAKSVQAIVAEAANHVAKEAREALLDGRPYSMLRISEGEGNLIAPAFPGWDGPLALKYYCDYLGPRLGFDGGLEDACRIAASLVEAISNADAVGFRGLDRGLVGSELPVIGDLVRAGNAWAAIGMMISRAYLERELERGSFNDTTLCTMWIYSGLLPRLDELVESARRVLIVSGLPELEGAFVRRFPGKEFTLIAVPNYETWNQGPPPVSHYGEFPVIVRRVKAETKPGTLAIIGAGPFAKAYCDEVKRSGGVGMDLGSGLNLLLGQAIRPVHSRLNVPALRWS